jgi:tetratricopeptide (TPR) repeat protein
MCRNELLSINDLVFSLLSPSPVLSSERFQKEAFLLYNCVFKDFMVDPLFVPTDTGPHSTNIENSLDELTKNHLIEKRTELGDNLFVLIDEAKNQIMSKLKKTRIDQNELDRYKTQWESLSMSELSRYIFLNYPVYSFKTDIKYLIEQEIFDTTTVKNIGNNLLDLGRYEDAIKCYDKALKIDPNEKDVLCNKGLSLQGLRKYDEAIVQFDEALKVDPKYVEALNAKGVCLSAQGMNEEAIVQFDEALKVDPKYVEALNAKGVCLSAQGMNEEAIVQFDEALKVDPYSPYVLNNKGVSLFKLRRDDEALKYYDKALRIDPTYQLAFRNKGDLFYEKHDYDAAISCYKNVLNYNERYADVLRERGILLLDNKDPKSIIYLSESFKLNPNQVTKQLLEQAIFYSGSILVSQHLELTKAKINRSIEEARMEIPRNTQTFNDYQEQTLQAAKEIVDSYLDSQKEIINLFQSAWTSHFGNQYSIWNNWASPTRIAERCTRAIGNIAENTLTATRIGNNATIANMEAFRKFIQHEVDAKKNSSIGRDTTKSS